MRSSIRWPMACTTSLQPQDLDITEAENCKNPPTYSGLQRDFKQTACDGWQTICYWGILLKLYLSSLLCTEGSTFLLGKSKTKLNSSGSIPSAPWLRRNVSYHCCECEILTAPLKGHIVGSYFSIAHTCFISILSLVSRAVDTFPLNSRPSFVIFRRMSLTSSPKYRLLIIFSNLEWEARGITGVHQLTGATASSSMFLCRSII